MEARWCLAMMMLGPLLGTDMAKVWTADDALLDLIRDREVIGAVLRDVAGDTVAKANEGATGKVHRRIVRDCLTGNGRAKVEGWVPKWMAFLPAAYTERGGVPTFSRPRRRRSSPSFPRRHRFVRRRDRGWRPRGRQRFVALGESQTLVSAS